MRLFLISLGSLVVVGMILASVHFWGLGRAPDVFDHPWLHLQTPWMIVPLKLKDQAPPTALLWIDVVRSREKNLYALTGSIDLTQTEWPDDELKKVGSSLPELLNTIKDRNLVINIVSNATDIDLQMSDLIGKSGEGRILIQSDYDLVLESIKKLQPLWLYGSSQSDRVRFATFASMWIVTATPFKGDVYVGPFRQRKITLLTPEIASEVKRRGKKLIVGPLETKAELELALRLGADGVFIDQAELIGIR